MRENIEDKVVAHRHDTHIAFTPVFTVIYTVTLRHLAERRNCFSMRESCAFAFCTDCSPTAMYLKIVERSVCVVSVKTIE